MLFFSIEHASTSKLLLLRMRVFIGSLNSQTGARARYRERSFGSFSARIHVTCRLNEPDEIEPWANAEADNVRRMYFLEWTFLDCARLEQLARIAGARMTGE